MQRQRFRKAVVGTLLRAAVGALAWHAWPVSALAATQPAGHELGEVLPAWSALPFAGLLLSIALLPLLAPHLWTRRVGRVTALWAAAFLVPFVLAYRGAALHEIAHTALADYVPFILLLAALFTVGGGVHARGTPHGSPAGNAAILAIGTLLASFIGTTGAAILLIRPLLRANRHRRHRAHTVVFFIVLVANVGGVLTPLGDPPLFLGFLHGVPFFWTLGLWCEMLAVAALALVAYVALEAFLWRREGADARAAALAPRGRLRIEGRRNLLILAGVLAAVVFSGTLRLGEVSILGVGLPLAGLLRDAVLATLLAVSWFATPHRLRHENEFTWEPIREVAIVFAGLFATMMPALAMLRAGERGALSLLVGAVHGPVGFFWATGALSSFLDNAPTYLTFLSTALGRLLPGVPEHQAVLRLIAEHPAHLRAIATGAVFMGANTYIGNAPNFMVKAIAERSGVAMPSFFGYIARYTLPVLVPAFLVTTWLFFG